jgi:hypothetical protein
MAFVRSDDINITGLDSVPPVIPSSNNNGGIIKHVRAHVAILAADVDTNNFRMARLPSNAVIKDIKVLCDAITGGTDYDLGVAYTPNKGGAIIDGDCLMDGQTLATASKVLDGFSAPAIENRDRELWEHAGLLADPNTNLDIVLTANTIGTADGDVVVEIFYALK